MAELVHVTDAGFEDEVVNSEKAVLLDPQAVIWSETSFVPAIDWHTRYRPDTDSYKQVKRLLDHVHPSSPRFWYVGEDVHHAPPSLGRDSHATE